MRHYKIELENKYILPDFYISNKNIIIKYDGTTL